MFGSNKLGEHIPTQPGLFDEAVLALLLLAKELGFLPAVSDKGLKKINVRTQKYMKKEEGERQGQVNTQLVGTMTSCRAPLAWSKAFSMAAIPSSRLSRSMLSTASSRVKSVDVGSYGFIHWRQAHPVRVSGCPQCQG